MLPVVDWCYLLSPACLPIWCSWWWWRWYRWMPFNNGSTTFLPDGMAAMTMIVEPGRDRRRWPIMTLLMPANDRPGNDLTCQTWPAGNFTFCTVIDWSWSFAISAASVTMIPFTYTTDCWSSVPLPVMVDDLPADVQWWPASDDRPDDLTVARCSMVTLTFLPSTGDDLPAARPVASCWTANIWLQWPPATVPASRSDWCRYRPESCCLLPDDLLSFTWAVRWWCWLMVMILFVTCCCSCYGRWWSWSWSFDLLLSILAWWWYVAGLMVMIFTCWWSFAIYAIWSFVL